MHFSYERAKLITSSYDKTIKVFDPFNNYHCDITINYTDTILSGSTDHSITMNYLVSMIKNIILFKN